MGIMPLPIIAIVGRPNVGKSSLLNGLAGRRIAIVDAQPGVTRDRINAPIELGDGYVELVDTGGIGLDDADGLSDHVEAQIGYALAEADLILFVVDAREGLTPLDEHVARRLRRQDKPVILVANKVDEPDQLTEIHEMNRLGFGEPLAVSAIHARGLADLVDRAAGLLGPSAEAPPQAVMKLAVVGKRNAGKSTFINALAGRERVIVAETPGTTRDSVDVHVEWAGRTFTLIDTAGLRKRRKIASDVEYYGRHRALRSIRRADVVALLIDASVKVSQVDKDLSREIADQFKPVALVVNKWDLARRAASGDDYHQYLDKVLPELSYAPISLTSATEGLNLRETVDLAEQLYRQACTRVPTAEMNVAVKEIAALRGPSHKHGTRPPKILYASQIAVSPPTIVCFVSDVRSFDTTYQRFLINQFRLRLPFAEVPIRLLFRSRHRSRAD